MLILMAGLPGTGKTTVAKQLAERLKAVILSKDDIRHALFAPQLVEYSTAQDDFVVEILLHTAEYIWRRHPGLLIIVDGRTFARESQRQQAIEFAERDEQAWRIIECVCADEVARKRLEKPDPHHPAANRTVKLYDDLKRTWEPVRKNRILVDTTVGFSVDEIVAAL